MAEKVLKVKTVSEVAEAISGLTDLHGSLRGVGTAAFEAAGKSKGEWKALEAEWAKATTTAKGVATQVQGVESALNALGRASSQSQLESNLVKSQVEFRRLQATMREVAATGGTIDDGVVSSMNVMRAAIDAGKAKLNELKTSTEAAKRELGLLGNEGAKAGKGVAGVGDAVGGLGDKMKKSTEGLNKFKASAMETWGALQLGVQLGNALADAIDKWDAKAAIKAKKEADAVVKAQLLDAANRAVTKGLIEQGKTFDETIQNYVEMTVGMGKLTEEGRAYIATVAGMKAPPAWKDIEARAEAMAITLQGAYARSEEEGKRWALANAAEIKAVIAAFDQVGKTVPEALLSSVAAAEKWAAENEKAAASARGLGDAAAAAVSGVDALKAALEGIGKGDVTASITAVAEALQRIREDGGNVGEAAAGNADGLQKLRDAAAQSADGLQKFRQEVADQLPAYQATALAEAQYAGALSDLTTKTNEYEDARRAANEADQSAVESIIALEERTAQAVYSIDTIGEAWAKASGQAAGFTVEVRHATQAVTETTPEFDAFIESLAVTSDEFERMTPYVGALIAQLEAGKISPEEFGQAIDNMRVAFMQLQGVSGQMYGDLESLFNRLRALLNDFVYSENPRNKPKR